MIFKDSNGCKNKKEENKMLEDIVGYLKEFSFLNLC